MENDYASEGSRDTSRHASLSLDTSLDINITDKDHATDVSSVVPSTPVYGPDGMGGYLTPYNMTMIYNPTSLFETGVSVLGYRPQLIPFDSDNTKGIELHADSIEYLTPEMFVFGTHLPVETLKAFHQRGFSTIHIFPYRPTDKYDELVNMENPYVHLVKLQNLTEHIKIEQMTGTHALEYIMCHTFGLESVFIPDSLRDGRYFVNGICAQTNTLGEPIPFEETLTKINTMRGFQEIEDLTAYGKFLSVNAERSANKSLASSPVLKLDITCAVPGVNSQSDAPATLYATFVHLPANRSSLENEACSELARMAPRTAMVNYLLRTEFVIEESFENDDAVNAAHTAYLNVILSGNYNAPIGARELLTAWNAKDIIGGHGIARGKIYNFNEILGV